MERGQTHIRTRPGGSTAYTDGKTRSELQGYTMSYSLADKPFDVIVPVVGDDDADVQMARNEVRHGEPIVAIEVLLSVAELEKIQITPELLNDAHEVL